MRTNVQKVHTKSLRTFFLFCTVVIFLVLLSLGYKGVQMVQKSLYNGVDRFTIAYISQPQRVVIYSVDPKAKSLSTLTITITKTIPSLTQVLGIPIDATVQPKRATDETFYHTQLFSSLAFTPFRYTTEMTVVDSFRLFLLTQSKTYSDNEVLQFSYPKDEEAIAATSESLFKETVITDEGATIEVINASGVAGLGVRLERMLTNMGATIIAVSGSQQTVARSTIRFSDEKSQTVRRLSDVLGFSKNLSDKKSLADVTITIGEDRKENAPF